MPAELTAPLAAAALAVALLALLLSVAVILRLRRTGRRRGIPSVGDETLDRLLADHLRRIDALGTELLALAEHVDRVEADGRRALARVGVVRFNPFEDTGGNQSFALALLDSRSDGIVVSSLHSRQQTRIYLKAIAAGRSEAPLSEEEAEALRQAGASAAAAAPR